MPQPLPIDPALQGEPTVDPAVFIRGAFEGAAIAAMIQERIDALGEGDGDAARLLELGVLYQLAGDRIGARTCQDAALGLVRLYRHAAPERPTLRLLMLATAGDLMTNTPFELMIEGRGMAVAKLYLAAGEPWPEAVPDHDLAFMAVSESDETRPLLGTLGALEARWPRPMVNRAAPVLELARDRLYEVLEGAPGILIPPTVRLPRERLMQPDAAAVLAEALGGHAFPIIIRPVGSHAGKALERIEDLPALSAYLATETAERVYVSPFVDYASADGHYRKYRIAFFDGRPFLCHLAIGDHWMVHYLNAGMAEDPAKRAAEDAGMARFDEDFAVRHAAAFAALHERLGLDYFAVDCAETRDGRLLIFEADVAMIVHDLDPADLYPYKKRQMRKVFDAFEAFLRRHAGEPGR